MIGGDGWRRDNDEEHLLDQLKEIEQNETKSNSMDMRRIFYSVYYPLSPSSPITFILLLLKINENVINK